MTDEAQQDPTFDPFDPENLRINPEDLDDIAVKKVLLTVPVRKPRKSEFFRVNESAAYTVDTAVLIHEQGLDRETYLLAPNMRSALPDMTVTVRLFTCLSRRDVLFLWPARLPTPDGNTGRAWHTSALEAAEIAKKHWVRIQGDKELGAYVTHQAQGDLGNPIWPSQPLKELLKIAFKERLIDTPFHDVLRELRGEM